MHLDNEAYFIAAQTSVVPIAWGEPGTCKTRSIEAWAKYMDYECISRSLSQHEPTDIAGYPRPNKDETYVNFLLPEFLYKCRLSKKPIVLFLDELTTCQPSTQAAALQLMTHYKELLGDNVILCCAANPPECAANGYNLEPPMNNRLYHHKWELDNPAWIQSFMQGFPEQQHKKLPENWRDYIFEARSLIGAFLTKSPISIHQMPKKDGDQKQWGPESAWASRRSWTNAAELFAAAMSLGYEASKERVHPVCNELLYGCVGPASNKFFDWKRTLKLLSPEETIKLLKSGKFNKSHFPERSDECYAYFGCFISHCILHPTKEKLDYAWELFANGMEMGKKDIAVAVKDQLYAVSKDFRVNQQKYAIPNRAAALASQLYQRLHGK